MFRTLYTYDDAYSHEFGSANNEPSMTQQSDMADADINIIMQRYGATGQLPQVQLEALSGDFTTVGDYRACVERIKAAEEAFMNVDAKVRKEFDNDPARFIEFVNNPENKEQLQKWGLAKQEPTKETTLADLHDTLQKMVPPTEYDDNGYRERQNQNPRNTDPRGGNPGGPGDPRGPRLPVR